MRFIINEYKNNNYTVLHFYENGENGDHVQVLWNGGILNDHYYTNKQTAKRRFKTECHRVDIRRVLP